MKNVKINPPAIKEINPKLKNNVLMLPLPQKIKGDVIVHGE